MNSRTTHSTKYTGHGPKYSQIIDLILKEIEKKIFSPGDRIPSIKEASEEYLISRDTVEKAYKELSQRGVLISVPGKGYYVKGNSSSRMKIMALMPEMKQEEQVFYNAFLQGLGKQAISHLYCFGNDPKHFADTLKYHLGDYDYYLIWPKLIQDFPEVKSQIRKIPQNKLIHINAKNKAHTTVLSKNIVHSLNSLQNLQTKYDTWAIVFPESTSNTQQEWKEALLLAASKMNIEAVEIPPSRIHTINKKTLCFTWDSPQLLSLIKHCHATGMLTGEDLGLISLKDHPLKKALAGGITTLTLATKKLGSYAAQLVLKQSKDSLAFETELTVRNSA